MEVYEDIRADRFRRPVFRRMEKVDRERQLHLQAEEQEADGAIEMTERYAECCSNTAILHYPIFV
jgi:hypothetical protein